MKIEAGKFYRTRDGQKVGPVRRGDEHSKARYWEVLGDFPNGARRAWHEDGMFWPIGSPCRDDENAGYDIIAEWTDMPDLTALTTPYGLLDRETQEALKAHGGPYEFWIGDVWDEIRDPGWGGKYAYRVKPAPPKPREFWLGCAGGYRHVYDHANSAQVYKDCNSGAEIIHVREVLE